MQERKIIQKSKSFKDLDRTLKKLIKKKKSKLAGSIFEHLVKLYFEVSPEYKSKLSNVYLLNEVPTKIKKKLKLPNTDEGIDLIAVTYDNQYWAIQCKYRSDNSETIKVKGDLATFNNLAFTVCKNISHGIVCSTVNRPPKKTKLLSVGYVLLTEWLKLDRDNGELYNQIKARAVGKIIKPKKLNPRAHQKKAIKKSISYFKINERGKMIMPCGTGKSLTAFWIAKKMKSKSILIAVPSLALLQQTLKVWTREFLLNNIEPDWLCVCSDDTVKEEQDDFVSFSADLGIKVDTDPRVIRNFLRKKTKKLKIVFTTYQSGRATAIGSKNFIYDFGIMDEAHKTVGSSKKPMAYLLHQKNIKIKKRLFMTATERLFRGDSDKYMSMDDPRDYGKIIYELSFKDAINAKPPIISDYKIITFGITTPEIERITEDNKYLDVKNELKDITARELASAIALRKAIKKLKIKNAISFHRSIKRAENFRKQQDLISKIYPNYGKIKTFHVRGDMPTSDRALEMLSFEEEKGLMTNARCLTEGVDLPAIDCVCFTDPKRSKVDIVQAAGRALRLSKGKKFGYILIPIFIPKGVDFNQAAEDQGFDDISITVRALATTDKRIIEYLRAISEGKKPKGGSPVEGINSINNLYKVEAEEFDNALKLKVWDKVGRANYRSYEETKKFISNYKIKDSVDWHKNFCKKYKPVDIPRNPQRVYKINGWISWKEFLGQNYESRFGRDYYDYETASKNLKKLKIKTFKEYLNYIKKNNLLQKYPIVPSEAYKNKGWIRTSNYLGSEKRMKVNWPTYNEAKNFIWKKKLNSYNEYRSFVKSHVGYPELPMKPNVIYENKGWINFGDFLGNGKLANQDKVFLSYKEAKILCVKNKIKNNRDYSKFRAKNPKFLLPSYPPTAYKKHWKNWPDFLNVNKSINLKNTPFNVARNYARRLKLNNRIEWTEFCRSGKKPNHIPSMPQKIYKEFKGYQDFLGYKKVIKTFKSIEETKKLMKNLKINTKQKYKKLLSQKKKNMTMQIKLYGIPSNPEISYKSKWTTWNDFLN